MAIHGVPADAIARSRTRVRARLDPPIATKRSRARGLDLRLARHDGWHGLFDRWHERAPRRSTKAVVGVDNNPNDQRGNHDGDYDPAKVALVIQCFHGGLPRMTSAR